MVLDERRATDPAILAALDSIRGEVSALRDDMREDIRAVREDMQTSIDAVIATHGREHSIERKYIDGLRTEAVIAHERFDAFIRNAELAQARRDGYLGVFRFTIELLGRYYRPLGALIITMALAFASAIGALRIDISIQ